MPGLETVPRPVLLGIAHYPVLAGTVLDYAPENPQSVLDCTFGHGGHAGLILKHFPTISTYVGLDRDISVIQNPQITDPKIILHHLNFAQMQAVLSEEPGFDWILMDLGTSQLQLQTASRGFSFLREGPLDMRMDQSQGPTLHEYLHMVSETELADTIFEYGEERFSRRIAKAVIEGLEQIKTTADLARIVEKAVPKAHRMKQRIHAATRTFQALRIRLNEELFSLQEGLNQAFHLLKPKGRLMVISFHSLEDRIVKQKFKHWASEEIAYRPLPVVVRRAQGLLVERKILVPEDREVAENSPSRSARMRVFEKF